MPSQEIKKIYITKTITGNYKPLSAKKRCHPRMIKKLGELSQISLLGVRQEMETEV